MIGSRDRAAFRGPPRRRAAIAAVVGTILFVPLPARAQAGPTPAAPPAPAAGGTPAGAAAAAPPAPATTNSIAGFGFGNPQSPNGTIGGGNATESSAHPVTGDQEDTFDFGAKPGAGAAVHGDQDGPVYLGQGGQGPAGSGGSGGFVGEVPTSHLVRRGDTLWGICGYYFENPYQWPRIWSFNPQIHNPNWIYPGDEVKLKALAGPGRESSTMGPRPTAPEAGAGTSLGGTSLVDRRRQVPVGTVFLRDQGWIRDPNDEVWGDITGANADKMFLSDLDEVYLHIDKGHEVHLGQDLTIFRPLHTVHAGTIVQIAGTARINQWDERNRVARAQVVESLNVIERGSKVGPLSRSFEIVPPRRNDAEVHARVLATLHPNEFFGMHQVVFIDAGEDKGLKVGNRLFVIHRGDAWRDSLATPHAGDRVSPDDETPMPPMESTPGSRSDEKHYPEEIVAEMRVVAVKKDSATCLLTESRVELEYGDNAVARKGY